MSMILPQVHTKVLDSNPTSGKSLRSLKPCIQSVAVSTPRTHHSVMAPTSIYLVRWKNAKRHVLRRMITRTAAKCAPIVDGYQTFDGTPIVEIYDLGTISLTFTTRPKMCILQRVVNRFHKAYDAL